MKLSVNNVGLSRGGRTVLDGVSLTVEPGELLCLLGPNGSGKSTLLDIMTGLLEPGGGSVTLDDTPILSRPAASRARSLAYLPQTRSIEWRLAVRDIVMLGRYPHRKGFAPPARSDHEAVARAMALADVADLAERTADTLSGGEQTRVLLARAVAVEAPLLVADEPLAALDPFHQERVMAALSALAREGTGVVVVVHDRAHAARHADRIALLDRGRIVADGSPADTLDAATLTSVYRIDTLAALRDRDGGLRTVQTPALHPNAEPPPA